MVNNSTRLFMLWLFFIFGVLVASQTLAALTQDNLTESQKEDIKTLVQLVDGAMVGEQYLDEKEVGWRNDFLRTLESKVYVPFRLTIPLDKMEALPTLLYIRVTERASARSDELAHVTTAGRTLEEKRIENGFDFESVYFFELRNRDSRFYQVTRAFAVPAGEYDVFIGLLQYGSVTATPTVLLIRQPLTVPNYWADELDTSTLILAERIESLEKPLEREHQKSEPYTFGVLRVVPAFESKFTKSEDLSILFLVYNPKLGSDENPNVVIDYKFHKTTSGIEQFFNQTNSQTFNAETLSPQFDLNGGHQLVAGQSVPLSTFPVGHYRLEIEIMDMNSGISLERNVKFTVTDSVL